MLEIKNLSSGYGKKQVLFNVSFEVKTSEIVLLSGGNGSGKSTILKCIYNLLPLWGGSVRFENSRIDTLKPSELIRKGIVYVPQKNFCFENLTVEENLIIAGTIYKKNELKNRIAIVYNQTGLQQYKNRNPINLSGGERKILAFGMGLMHQPKMILLDEPFSGVDIKNSESLYSIFLSSFKHKDMSVILVEHKNTEHKLFTRKIFIELGTINYTQP